MIQSRVPDFEYVGGFKGSEDDVILKCKHCGDVVKRSMISVRHRNIRCRRCDDIKRNEEQERKRQEQAERERLKRIEKYKNTKRIQLKAKQCEVCGSLYLSSRKYCSDACMKRIANRKKDKRIAKDKMINNDITLEKLYIRDDGVCHLCGELCDWDDEPNCIGSKYPSIDHLIPIADGGEHSWNNVKLAHWYCNTIRGNAPLSEWF